MRERLAALAELGLNHIGVVSRARYDAAAPAHLACERLHAGTRAVVVVGSGGRAHWGRFLDYVAADPVTRLAKTRHPLDDFCAAVIPRWDGCRVIFPTTDAPPGFDFMRLAELAGLGAPSELGTLVSEKFGPWFGLRAAIFVPDALCDSPPAKNLCEGCAAPCRAACPVGAVGVVAAVGVAGTLDWRRCIDERMRQGSGCQDGCFARAACVISPQSAYDDLETTYHYNRTLGRRLLCERFLVEDLSGPS